MPPALDEDRERQLAALRRYGSDLDVRRQHEAAATARPAAERRRRSWPWLLVTVALMAVSLSGGIAIVSVGPPLLSIAPLLKSLTSS